MEWSACKTLLLKERSRSCHQWIQDGSGGSSATAAAADAGAATAAAALWQDGVTTTVLWQDGGTTTALLGDDNEGGVGAVAAAMRHEAMSDATSL